MSYQKQIQSINKNISNDKTISKSSKQKEIKNQNQKFEDITLNQKKYFEEFQGIGYQFEITNYKPILFFGVVREITGYSEEDFLSGRIELKSLIHPEDAALVNEETYKVINNAGYLSIIEYRISNKNGTIHWVRDIKKLIKDKNNKRKIIQGTIFDVTECKIIEDDLKLSEFRYRTLVDNVPGTIYRCQVRSPWRMEHISPMVEHLTGYLPDKFLIDGLTWAEIVYPDDLDYIINAVEEAVDKKEIYILEYRIIHIDGNIRWIFERGKAYYDEKGNPLWLEGVLLDVTDWKKAEQLLKESEERFRMIFQTSPDAIVLSTFDTGEYIDFNDGFIKLTGLSREQIIGKTAYDIHLWKEQTHRDKFLTEINKLGYIINYEAELNVSNNMVHTCLISSRVIMYNNEKHLISILKDIGELKDAEEKVRKLNTELEQRVHDRTAELEETLKILRNEYDEKSKAQIELMKAKEELAKALNAEKELSSMKSSFISMISHEYRTPLTVILSSSEILRRYFEINELEAKFYKHLDNIAESVQIMTRLLENILVISKSEASSLYYESSKFNVVEFFVRLIHEIEFSDKGVHHFKFDIESESIEVTSDQKLLKQVLFNIVSNAVKFSTANTEIISSVKDKGDTVEISIQDFGIGIPIEDEPHIYDTFFRCKNSGSMKGSGIGLSVAKRCVDILKGKIEVESEINHGSVFRVILSKNL